MITKSEKKRIIKHIGKFYTAKIQAQLKAKNKTNENGKTHSKAQITNVMNGHYNHDTIEQAILDAVDKEIQVKKELKEKRKAILKG